MKVSYRDITSQGASVLWGTRAAERNTETRKRLEKEHNVRIGDEVKIVTEEVSEEKDKKKEYLLQYRKAERREQNILEEIQELRADKLFPSVSMDGMPKGSGQADLSDFVALMDELIEKLKEERLCKVKLRMEIEGKIKRMDDTDEADLLRMRYLRGMKWEEVMAKTGYCRAQVNRIHGRALEHFEM